MLEKFFCNLALFITDFIPPFYIYLFFLNIFKLTLYSYVGSSIIFYFEERYCEKKNDIELRGTIKSFLKTYFNRLLLVYLFTFFLFIVFKGFFYPDTFKNLNVIFFFPILSIFLLNFEIIIIEFFYEKLWEKLSLKLHRRIGLLKSLLLVMILFLINSIFSYELFSLKLKEKNVIIKIFANKISIFNFLFSFSNSLVLGSLILFSFLVFNNLKDKKILLRRAFNYLGLSFLSFILFGFIFAYKTRKMWIENFSRILSLNGLFFLFVLFLISGITIVFLSKSLFIYGKEREITILALLMIFLSTYMSETIKEKIKLPYTIYGVVYANDIDIKKVRYYQDNGQKDEVEKFLKNDEAVKRIVFGRSCGFCHTLKNYKGIKLLSKNEIDYLSSLVRRSSYFKGPMPPFPGREDDAELIAKFIKDNFKEKNSKKMSGKEIFEAKCAVCHTLDSSFRPLEKRLKNLKESEIKEILDNLGNITSSMPVWKDDEEGKEKVIKFLKKEDQ